jgi:hypothetical protein
MKGRAAKWLLLLAWIAIVAGVSGCASTEPDNVSVRPWNSPSGTANALGGMNYQHQ